MEIGIADDRVGGGPRGGGRAAVDQQLQIWRVVLTEVDGRFENLLVLRLAGFVKLEDVGVLEDGFLFAADRQTHDRLLRPDTRCDNHAIRVVAFPLDGPHLVEWRTVFPDAVLGDVILDELDRLAALLLDLVLQRGVLLLDRLRGDEWGLREAFGPLTDIRPQWLEQLGGHVRGLGGRADADQLAGLADQVLRTRVAPQVGRADHQGRIPDELVAVQAVTRVVEEDEGTTARADDDLSEGVVFVWRHDELQIIRPMERESRVYFYANSLVRVRKGCY